MTEGVSTSNDADAAAQRAAEAARLRKERREAKLKAGGSARLDKITGMSGRPKADFDPPSTTESETSTPTATPASKSAAANSPDADPEEVDISEHFFAPKTTARTQGASPAVPGPNMSEDALRQMMLGMDPAAAGQGQQTPQNGQNPFGGMPGAEDDPIMKMMSQMMSGGGAGGSPFGGLGGMAGMPGMPGSAAQQTAPLDPYTALWRLLHALVALGLGFYIVLLTPFRGTQLERDMAAASEIQENEERKKLFFWIFATAEACLLTTRFFLDKGREPPAGIAYTLTGYLPEPYKGYVQVIMRYGQIFSTVRSDILACMFVLGVCAWWRG